MLSSGSKKSMQARRSASAVLLEAAEIVAANSGLVNIGKPKIVGLGSITFCIHKYSSGFRFPYILIFSQI